MSEKEQMAQQAQQPPPQQTFTVVQPTVVQQVPDLGEFPAVVTCPVGGHQVTTNVHYQIGLMVWIVVGVMILLGFLCFAWIPFLITSLKDVVHTCPEDGTVIGVYQRMKF